MEALFRSFGDILALLDNITIDSNMNNMEFSSSLLCHGVVMSIRYCLESSLVPFSNHPDSALTPVDINLSASLLSEIFRNVVDISIRALNVGMSIVAEAKSDVPFSIIPTSKELARSVSDSSDFRTKGPLNGSTVTSGVNMSASYMNTNSLMDLTSGDSDKGIDAQKAVVAAWLLVKESTNLLSVLIELSCRFRSPSSSSSTNMVSLNTCIYE
jgi:hypothetical protein